jgi:hypothetical protein
VFTITVTSIGPGTAKEVTLSDTLPAGIIWSEDNTSCSIAGLLLTCNFGDLAAGQVRVVNVTGLTDAADCGTLNNTVNISATNEPATVLANNTSSASINVLCALIIVQKVTVPSGDTTAFEFDTSYSANFFLSDGQANISGPLAPGTGYSVAELVPAGWDVDNVLCSDNSPRNNINLSGGETVTCVFTNTKRGNLALLKVTNGQVRSDLDIQFRFYRDGVVNGDLSGDETLLQTVSTLGDADGNLVFASVAPGNYTVCESPVPAGYTSLWTINGGVVTPYNPGANDTPPEDLGVRCYDFTIAAGATVAIRVENDFPGGDPRTIGYWKNWNRCTGGGQAANADANGNGENGFWLVEDLLPQTVGDLVVGNCQDAVDILNKSDLSGRKKANDAAYELASQLLAAKFNLAAGAETCSAIEQAVMNGQNLLALIDFNGTGGYLDSKVKGTTLIQRRNQALQLANALDQYNNGNLCP